MNDEQHPHPDSTWTTQDYLFHLAKMHGGVPPEGASQGEMAATHARYHVRDAK